MAKNSFDKHATSSYADSLVRQVPGYSTLFPTVSQLLKEAPQPMPVFWS